MKTMTLTADARRPMPLGGPPAGAAWQPLAWIGRVLAGAARSRTAPAAAASRQTAREAAAVRAMASRHQRFDPRFAADLFAAADRHEWAGGDGRKP